MGPHKTGTKSIQFFLQENRAKLLEHGYFVPESGNNHGGHHTIVRQLCGEEVPHHHRRAAAKFIEALGDTRCEAVIISSEALERLLRNRDYAKAFFKTVRKVNLEPKLVIFARNQPQLINSRYVEVVKSFRRCEAFEAFVRAEIHHSTFRYSDLIALAEGFDAKLIPRPFTRETLDRGVVVDFLQTIGLDPSRFDGTNIRRNRTAGPFTVSVARDVLRLTASLGRPLTLLQARRCKRKLTAYLQERGLADTGYCGLSSGLARHIEKEWQEPNDVFAQQIWRRPWKEVFAADVGREFAPNDFEITEPDEHTQRRRRQVVDEILALTKEIMVDPMLTPESP